MTSAPSRANASAVARPIPCPAAVRNARLPSNRPIPSPFADLFRRSMCDFVRAGRPGLDLDRCMGDAVNATRAAP